MQLELKEGEVYFTLKEIAVMLHRSVKTVSNWTRLGNSKNVLPVQRLLGRLVVTKSDLDRFIITPKGRGYKYGKKPS
jgi:hypothetical protein